MERGGGEGRAGTEKRDREPDRQEVRRDKNSESERERDTREPPIQGDEDGSTFNETKA